MVLTNLEKAVAERNTQEFMIQRLSAKSTRAGLTEVEIDYLISKLETLTDDIKDNHRRIVLCIPTDLPDHEKEFGNLLDEVDKITCDLMAIKATIATPSTSGSTRSSSATAAEVRLPKIELQKFSGDINEWMSFRDMFVASVHNNATLSNAQKFTYLQTSLVGNASKLIKSISLTDANYTIAWNIVINRFQNERELFFAIIKKFINHPKLHHESSAELRSIIDATNECTRSLENLKVPVDKWDGILVFHIIQMLDSASRQFWELSLPDTSIPNLADLLAFLEQRARSLAVSDSAQQSSSTKPSNDKSKSHVHHTNSNNQKQSSLKCKFCGNSHFQYQCSKFKAMSIPDRLEAAKQNSLCFNCLRENHSAPKCQSQKSCFTCKKRHHTLLHQEQGNQNSNAQSSSSAFNGFVNSQSSSSQKVTRNQTLLATALVKIKTSGGESFQCRAFLDGGSTDSFITESCVNRLRLPRTNSNTSIIGLGSSTVGNTRGITSIILMPHFNSAYNFCLNIEAYIIPKVTSKLPLSPCYANDWTHLNNIQLADPKFNQQSDIDLLLGADVFYDILLNGKKFGPKGSAVAQRSKLGWLVAGRTSTPSKQIQVYHLTLDENLQRFWELENIPKTRVSTAEEQSCEDHFMKTHNRDPSGRYVVNIPFKSSTKKLGSSREIASRRLMQIERRLDNQPQARELYYKFMASYIQLGHMTKLSPEEMSDSGINYIPHHYVLKDPDNLNKFRVVFDGSSKTSSGVSYNATQLVGATIQDSLVSILMRFRMHKIAFSADIAKMYRQVLVAPEHQKYQCILWRDSKSDPIQDYKLLTVTYGTASSPFLATRALKQLAIENRIQKPLASVVAERDFYVDDCMSGADTVLQAIRTIKELRDLIYSAGMDLRKFSSNSSAVLATIPAELRENQTDLFSFDEDDTVKTLGLIWNPSLDIFKFKVILPKEPQRFTKRIILSEVSKTFDPLGWLSPTVIRAKILLQDMWKLGLGWETPLPDHIIQQWLKFRKNLPLIESLTIPRWQLTSTTNIQLHGFCDASEKAYAAVIYIRCQLPNQTPQISFVIAKTKVAPIHTVTLPRLELCGALLLADLLEFVQDSLQIDFHQIKAWCDSTIVLHWIKSKSSDTNKFVANRVSKIQAVLSSQHWNHVSGIENPADCASRGVDPSELEKHPMWWSGPHWLKNDKPEPVNMIRTTTAKPEIIKSEQKKRIFVAATQTHDWIKRKQNDLDLSSHTGELSVDELDNALLTWVKIVQQCEFHKEIHSLNINQPISKKSKILSLCPFLDANQILRVGGRLRNSSSHPDKKTPMLLPRHHKLTELVIQNEHHNNFHAGTQLILSILQNRFWILRARDAVRHQVKKCVICTRYGASTQQQLMGDLPTHRVNPSRPFSKCGVDYAGPFQLRPIPSRSKVTFKAYLALFICFVTRAIHIEIVSSLSTSAFMAALKRFVSRRGKPTDIFSDCGTNFVGAAAELKEFLRLTSSKEHNQKLADQLAAENINWHFNPPGAPHMGGLWEAGVKSAKFHLHRVVGNTQLTFEEMETVMIQIEACLNSRPLSQISSDPNDLQALTPGHFLIGDSLKAIPEPDLTSEKLNRLTRWQLVQQLQQHFWHRWSTEYLSRLQQRPKWISQHQNIKINDMVLIKHENFSPTQWPLARVIDVHPGKDGITRVVTLKTSTGELKRPITKLCLLPVDNPEPKNNSLTLKIPNDEEGAPSESLV